ncbi:MAG: cysteine-rich CWC family protein [Flavobacteriaceae bacterium]|jgi:hypothetical protein|nr:cysteine-rich CWC family protein [Flavobacteriaceae bacterium]
MPEHEQKNCPKCNHLFECKAGTLELCQCSSIYLSQGEREYIQSRYEDCLCINCLKELKSEYHQLKLQKKLENISPLFTSGKSGKI